MSRKIIIALLMSATFFSCKKENGTTTCYECQMTVGSSAYSDAGCYDQATWNKMNVTDFTGNSIDKNTKCRKK